MFEYSVGPLLSGIDELPRVPFFSYLNQVQCIRKVSDPLTFSTFHYFTAFDFYLYWVITSIYTQYPIMTKQKPIFLEILAYIYITFA